MNRQNCGTTLAGFAVCSQLPGSFFVAQRFVHSQKKPGQLRGRMYRRPISLLFVSLFIGCTPVIQSYWNTLSGENSIVLLPDSPFPVPLRPVVYGWHIISSEAIRANEDVLEGIYWPILNIEDSPRLKNRIGAAAAPGIKSDVNRVTGFDTREEGFVVYVPSTYADDVPHGLWFSLSAWMDPWFSIFDARKLIWIRPLASPGKLTPHDYRVRLALEARRYALLNYNIDPDWIYIISTLSHGCAAVLTSFPGAFNGSIHMHEDRPEIFGPHIKTRQPYREEKVIQTLRRKNRFVCISARADDPYYKLMKDDYSQLRKRGIDA